MRHKKKAPGTEDFGKKLGLAISTRRKAKGMTQDDLAGVLGVDAETISRFERGTAAPSLERLFYLAQALGTGIGELLSETSLLPSDQAAQLVRSFLGLSKADQKLLLEFVQLLERR